MLPPFAMSHRLYPRDGDGRLACVCGAEEHDVLGRLSEPCPVYAPALVPRSFHERASRWSEQYERDQRLMRQQNHVNVAVYTGTELRDTPEFPRLPLWQQESIDTSAYYNLWRHNSGAWAAVAHFQPLDKTCLSQELARHDGDMVRWHCELRHPDGVTPRIDLSCE